MINIGVPVDVFVLLGEFREKGLGLHGLEVRLHRVGVHTCDAHAWAIGSRERASIGIVRRPVLVTSLGFVEGPAVHLVSGGLSFGGRRLVAQGL